VQASLLTLLANHKRGVVPSEVPKRFVERWGQPLLLIDAEGSTVTLKDLLFHHPQVLVEQDAGSTARLHHVCNLMVDSAEVEALRERALPLLRVQRELLDLLAGQGAWLTPRPGLLTPPPAPPPCKPPGHGCHLFSRTNLPMAHVCNWCAEAGVGVVASLIPDLYKRATKRALQLVDPSTGYKASLAALLRFHPNVRVMQDKGRTMYVYCGRPRPGAAPAAPQCEDRCSEAGAPPRPHCGAGSASSVTSSSASSDGETSADECDAASREPLHSCGNAAAEVGKGNQRTAPCLPSPDRSSATTPDVPQPPSPDGAGEASVGGTPAAGVAGEQKLLLQLLEAAGTAGVLASAMPSVFLVRYGRPVHLVEDNGMQVSLRDLLW
jgi:hypothetical protein